MNCLVTSKKINDLNKRLFDIKKHVSETNSKDIIKELKEEQKQIEKELKKLKEEYEKAVISKNLKEFINDNKDILKKDNLITDEIINTYEKTYNKQEEAKVEIDIVSEFILEKDKELTSFKSDIKDVDKSTLEVIDIVKEHQSNISDYFKKIDSIVVEERVREFSTLMNRTFALSKRTIRRKIESKIIEKITSKDIANMYFSAMMLKDIANINSDDNLVITTTYISNDYDSELRKGRSDLSFYRYLIVDALVSIKTIRSDFEKKFKGNIDFKSYDENISKIEDLEKTIVEEDIKLDSICNDYDNAITANNQKVKVK